MKRNRVTTRDVKFFLLGVATLFVLDVATNWRAHTKAFVEGMERSNEEHGKIAEETK